MNKNINNQTITRYAGISSTAEGYEFIIVKTFVDYNKRTAKRYKIRSASMKRFYSLSKTSSDIYSTKECHWAKYRSIRFS